MLAPAGVRDSATTRFPCYKCIVPREFLDEHGQAYPRRTGPFIDKQVSKMRYGLRPLFEVCWRSDRPPRRRRIEERHGKTAAEEYGAAHSITNKRTCLRRLLDFDPHVNTPLDMLHTMETGVFAMLLEFFDAYLLDQAREEGRTEKRAERVAAEFRKVIDRRLADFPRWQGQRRCARPHFARGAKV